MPDKSSPSSLEARLLDWLATRFGSDRRLRLPIGDDAAWLDLAPEASCVLATDMLMAGVHFEPPPASPWERIGQKALGVNLSDLAAMAARPVAALVSLALPRGTSEADVRRLYDGVVSLADRFGMVIAGGDTNVYEGPLVLNVAVVGVPMGETVWTRGGGRPGDWLAVTGALGGSILGKHWCPEPRLETAAALVKAGVPVSAAIDISDGLSLDLARLAQASGCGAIVRAADIPIAPAAVQLAQDGGPTALEHALTDGEDFELLITLPPAAWQQVETLETLPVPLTVIGELTDEPGLWCEDEQGKRRPLEPRGYWHG